MSILYILVMIGGLVFFHELGHFLIAKLFDVKVVRFSIGFGPRVVGFDYGETEYVICALPLGGYVQMMGHELADLEAIPEEDRGRALMGKPIWQRSLVILAGPVANILLAFAIYLGVTMNHTEAKPSVIGEVFSNTPAAAAGLAPGDRVVSIAGQPITYWHELQDIVSAAPEVPLAFEYERDGKREKTTITPLKRTSTDTMGLRQQTYGQIGILLGSYGPTIAIVKKDTPAEAAGLRSFDTIVTVDGQRIRRYDAFESRVRMSQGKALSLVVMRPKRLGVEYGKLSKYDMVEVSVTPKQVDGVWTIGARRAAMVLSEVVPGSPADAAGFKAGDLITALDGVEYNSWSVMSDRMRNRINVYIRDRPKEQEDDEVKVSFEITYQRAGAEAKTTLTPSVKSYEGEGKQKRYRTVMGWSQITDVVLPEDVPFPLGQRFSYATSNAVSETWTMVEMFLMLPKLFAERKIGSDSLGGPILIGELAAKAGQAGLEPFLRMMAVISINLAVLNMLPIPLLDGGQLALFAMEAIKRGPLSARVRQIAAYIGYVSIIMLMILAFKNDIERNWDRFVDWATEE